MAQVEATSLDPRIQRVQGELVNVTIAKAQVLAMLREHVLGLVNHEPILTTNRIATPVEFVRLDNGDYEVLVAITPTSLAMDRIARGAR